MLCELCSRKQINLAFGSIDGMAYKPTVMATRTCSTSIAIRMSWSSMPTMRNLRTGGILTIRSYSSFESHFFFSRLYGAIFLFWVFQALFPRSESSSCFLQFERDIFKMFVSDALSLPCHGYKILQYIQRVHAIGDSFRFPFFSAKISSICFLREIKECILNSRTEGVAGMFCNMGDNTKPQQISLFDALENRCVYERERERERE